MSKHTPGPWVSIESVLFDRPEICDEKDRRVAVCLSYYPMHEDTRTANARLIAAAPDMLEALEDLVEWADAVKGRAGVRMSDPHTGSIDTAKRAIAKAKGEI